MLCKARCVGRCRFQSTTRRHRIAFTRAFEAEQPLAVHAFRCASEATLPCQISVCKAKTLIKELCGAGDSFVNAAAKCTTLLYSGSADEGVRSLSLNVKQICRTLDEFARDFCKLDASAVFQKARTLDGNGDGQLTRDSSVEGGTPSGRALSTADQLHRANF